MSMTLRELLDDPTQPSVTVAHLTEDSRDVAPGDAFLAIRGAASDGHAFVDAAEAAGAVCVLAERPVRARVPLAVVPDLRTRRNALAARFYRDPSRALTCAAVTGTNGKTSVAFHIADLATRAGRRCGYMGTIGRGVVPDLEPARLTTESPCRLQRHLAELRDRGCEWVALEASSHALAQGRLDGVAVDAAIFTNLTRDHLDYHADFAAYGAAKRRLFDLPGVNLAVVNVDDPFGAELAAALRARGMRVLTCGVGADLCYRAITASVTGQVGELETPWGAARLQVPLPGDFVVANLLAAIAVLADAGVALAQLVASIATLTPVPGRLEVIGGSGAGRPTVVVDYAHTPDALAKVLRALRPHCAGRLVVVVGCGGDRDRGKRPLMARAAELGADVVWLTSDNPRSEDPQTILDDMRAGLEASARAHACVDRRETVTRALAGSRPGDVVLIAGKGHETWQEIQGERIPFSDRELARALLGAMPPGSHPSGAPPLPDGGALPGATH